MRTVGAPARSRESCPVRVGAWASHLSSLARLHSRGERGEPAVCARSVVTVHYLNFAALGASAAQPRNHRTSGPHVRRNRRNPQHDIQPNKQHPCQPCSAAVGGAGRR